MKFDKSCLDRKIEFSETTYRRDVYLSKPEVDRPYETTKQYKILKEAMRLIELGLRTDEDFYNYWEKEEYR